jgi:hypothetical protein
MKLKYFKVLFLITLFIGLNINHSYADPTYAVLDENNNVTNIIVCGSACESGTFAGQKVVLQVAADPITNENRGGFWNGPNTTKIDNSGTFTVNTGVPVTRSEIIECSDDLTDCLTATTVVNSSAYTFKYEDTLVNDVSNIAKEIAPEDNTGAEISVSSNNINESVSFNKRKTKDEIQQEALIQNAQTIIAKINKLISMLGLWTK